MLNWKSKLMPCHMNFWILSWFMYLLQCSDGHYIVSLKVTFVTENYSHNPLFDSKDIYVTHPFHTHPNLFIFKGHHNLNHLFCLFSKVQANVWHHPRCLFMIWDSMQRPRSKVWWINESFKNHKSLPIIKCQNNNSSVFLCLLSSPLCRIPMFEIRVWNVRVNAPLQ